jgi:lipoprotein-anchoring transpeptidase ErfK/SrfK
MRPTSPILALPLLAALTLGACGGGERPTLDATASRPASTTIAPAPTAPDRDAATPSTVAEVVDLDAIGIVARARADVSVYDAPHGTVQRVVPARTEFGSATTFAAIAWTDASHEWLQVALPIRPNGATGVIRVADVELGRTDLRITVDRAARRMVVRDGEATVVDTSIAIGTDSTPTPTGHFFVTDVIDNPNDAGAYGPFALGLSAHSDVLDQFGGGDGQIGIHGTDDAGSIGSAASHGCVRVPNDVVVQLAGLVPLGTPVTIV